MGSYASYRRDESAASSGPRLQRRAFSPGRPPHSQKSPQFLAYYAAAAAEEAEAAAVEADELAAAAAAAAEEAASSTTPHAAMAELETLAGHLEKLAAHDLPNIALVSPPAAAHSLDIVLTLLTSAAAAARAALLAVDAERIIPLLQHDDKAMRHDAIISLRQLEPADLARHAKEIAQNLLECEVTSILTKQAAAGDASPASDLRVPSPRKEPIMPVSVPNNPIEAPSEAEPQPRIEAGEEDANMLEGDGVEDDREGEGLQADTLVDANTGEDVLEEEQPLAFTNTEADGSIHSLDGKDAACDLSLSDSARKAIDVDEDGDGIPDVAKSLFFMVDADGDGVNDGLHADKLGLFAPQVGLQNERPFYSNVEHPSYALWWSSGKFWIGKSEDLGRNRGWLRVTSSDAIPPSDGWLVYSKPNKKWMPMEGFVCQER